MTTNLNPIRLEPCAVAPGGVEQMMVKLEQKARIKAVQLDEPDVFEVVKVIAGAARADKGDDLDITISPPNAFVIVLVRSKATEGEVKVCGGALLVDGDVQAAPLPPGNVLMQPAPTSMQAAPAPGTVGPSVAGASGGSVTLKTDARGWPLGGMNEVWVLMGRGEAERLMAAINGYPITGSERPALLRRFQQALGLIR